MQFEVQGDGWATFWTDEVRVTIVIVLFLVVLVNVCFPMGKEECEQGKVKGN